MSKSELKAITKAYKMLDRERWERARLISYYSVVGHTKGNLGPQKLIPLAWDTETSNSHPKPTKERLDKLLEKMKK